MQVQINMRFYFPSINSNKEEKYCFSKGIPHWWNINNDGNQISRFYNMYAL